MAGVAQFSLCLAMYSVSIFRNPIFGLLKFRQSSFCTARNDLLKQRQACTAPRLNEEKKSGVVMTKLNHSQKRLKASQLPLSAF